MTKPKFESKKPSQAGHDQGSLSKLLGVWAQQKLKGDAKTLDVIDATPEERASCIKLDVKLSKSYR